MQRNSQDNFKVPLTSSEAQGSSVNSTNVQQYGTMEESPNQLNIAIDNSSSDEQEDHGNNTGTTEAKHQHIHGAHNHPDGETSSDDEVPRGGGGGVRFRPNSLPSARYAAMHGSSGDIDGQQGDELKKKAFTPRMGGSAGDIDNVSHNEGYCLVFLRKTKYHHVIIDEKREKLRLQIRDDINDEEREKAEKVDALLHRKHNLLKHFKSTHIQYTIQTSEENSMFIYVIISITHDLAEQFADHKDLPVRIDPREAVLVGRESQDFLLAQRTCLGDNEDPPTFKDERVSNEDFEKLHLEEWDYIHVGYESAIPQSVYKRYGYRRHLLDNRLFLRILFELLTEDASMGGAGFKLGKYIRNRNHPLTGIFAINRLEEDGSTVLPYLTDNEKYWPQKWSVWRKKTDEIRSYYGELVAFYFAFLNHYTAWLLPAAIVGAIFFIIQLAAGKIAFEGSSIIILVILVWGTAMIEHWYRRENWLKYKWGMMTYRESEVPRPSFKGKYEISPGKGTLIETYSSYFQYYGKIVFSSSTMTLCIAIVGIVVFEMWKLKSIWGDSSTISIGIGILNSVQIQIFNIIYTKLAAFLNEFEGHRLEQDYYNHLVVKKIIFYVINSFNSLFYLAFYATNYDSQEDCLVSVRTQLLTLFLTAIFWQNFVEIALPKIYSLICAKIIENQERSLEEQEAVAGKTIAPAKSYSAENENLNESDADLMKQRQLHRQKSEDIVFEELEVSSAVMEDVNAQVMLAPSPDVLSNTSEMVIQYGYIMLFALVFPAMPLLALINNYFEVRVDIYNLLHCRRPIPYAASGIGVWKACIATLGSVAVFTNMALITFKTDTVKEIFGDDSDLDETKVTFFFIVSFFFLFCMFLVRYCINDIDQGTLDAIERQEQCEKHLLLNSVKKVAREQTMRDLMNKEKSKDH